MRAAALFFAVGSFGVLGAWTQTSRTVWEGVYTEAQSKRGESLYREHCAKCHGDDLMGAGEGVTPLVGPQYTGTWNGTTLGTMVERMRATMPPERPASLSRQQNADLMAYLLKANKFPAGKTELPPDAESLNQIQFKAKKPS